MRSIHHHFSGIARRYRQLRTTDVEPILCIKRRVKKFKKIIAADVGCGAGRYDLKLFRSLGNKLHLTCLDCSKEMLEQLSEYLCEHRIRNFQTIKSYAETLPFEDNSLDCIFSFNAIHHFEFVGFLKEASRVLKGDGYLFLYTRLRSQNSRNIWGRYFPMFSEKETRLHELEELEEHVREVPGFKIKCIKFFKYKRLASLNSLVKNARNGHYSTFYLYSEEELKEALDKFRESLRQNFSDLKNISWYDENVLLVLGNHAR